VVRLPRTLLDEASMAPSRVGTRSAATVEHIWHATGHPARAGLNVWRPCEQLGWPRQTMMLEAAAAALHLAETGAIAARGTLAPLLAREPHRPAYYGDRPAPAACNRKRERERAQEEVNAALEAARTDPGTARQMLTLCTFSCRTLAAFHRERQHLIGTGHPRATPLRPP
jgi:hypothetical protein